MLLNYSALQYISVAVLFTPLSDSYCKVSVYVHVFYIILMFDYLVIILYYVLCALYPFAADKGVSYLILFEVKNYTNYDALIK